MSEYHGSCLCESDPIVVRPNGKPAKVLLCSCLDCQKGAGGPAQTLAMYKTEDLIIEDPKGKMETFTITKTKSGAVKHKYFCRGCGCPVYTKPMHHEGKLVFLRASLLEHDQFVGLKLDGTLFPERAPDYCKVDVDKLGGHW